MVSNNFVQSFCQGLECGRLYSRLHLELVKFRAETGSFCIRKPIQNKTVVLDCSPAFQHFPKWEREKEEEARALVFQTGVPRPVNI